MIQSIPLWKVLLWLQKEVRMDTIGSKELEEECVVIVAIDSAKPKTNASCCTTNLE